MTPMLLLSLCIVLLYGNGMLKCVTSCTNTDIYFYMNVYNICVYYIQYQCYITIPQH